MIILINKHLFSNKLNKAKHRLILIKSILNFEKIIFMNRFNFYTYSIKFDI